MSADDDLGVYVRIGVDSGRVLLMFGGDPDCDQPRAITHWHIDPAQCLDIVEGMARAAFEADSSLRPVGDAAKAALVDQHRAKLIARCTLMMSSLRHDALKSDADCARDLVDTCLREIF